MSTTLDYSLRSAMSELYKEDRWGVLTLLILHANGLNRCWPSMKQIARELDICLASATRAKQWLVEHNAVTLVPYNKRVGDELDLPRRQHVYQLTGTVSVNNKAIPYLYQQQVTSKSEVLPDEISPDRISTPDSTKYYPEENTSKSTDTENSIAQGAALGPIVIYKPSPKASERSQPEQYNDLFEKIRLHCFEDDHSKATGKRVGPVAKAILADFPKLSVSEFEEFIHWWKVTKNIELPKGETSLPSAIGQWKNRENARSARDDTVMGKPPERRVK